MLTKLQIAVYSLHRAAPGKSSRALAGRRGPACCSAAPKLARPPVQAHTSGVHSCQSEVGPGLIVRWLSLLAGCRGDPGPLLVHSRATCKFCARQGRLAGRPEACEGGPEALKQHTVPTSCPGACCGDGAAWQKCPRVPKSQSWSWRVRQPQQCFFAAAATQPGPQLALQRFASLMA